MLRTWCRTLVLALPLLAAGLPVSAATTVAIERPASRPAAAALAPAVVVIRALPVPLAGGTVTVTAHAAGLDAPVKLTTLFVVGGAQAGTRERSMRAAVDAPPSVLDALARDPHATLTLSVCPKAHADACVTSGPYPVSFQPAE